MIPSLFRARKSAATFPGVERRSNLFHDASTSRDDCKKLETRRKRRRRRRRRVWLNGTARRSAREARLDRVSFERRSSVPRKIIPLFLEDRVHDSGSRVRHRSTRGYARRSCWFSFALFGTGTNTIRERGEIARRGKDGGFWLEEGTISLHRAPSPSPPWNSLFRILNINPGKLLARQQSFALVTGLLFVALAISNSYGSYLYIYISGTCVYTRTRAPHATAKQWEVI